MVQGLRRPVDAARNELLNLSTPPDARQRLVKTRPSICLKTGLACAYTLEVTLDDVPKKYQPYGWLKSGYWSISLDGLVGLGQFGSQI